MILIHSVFNHLFEVVFNFGLDLNIIICLEATITLSCKVLILILVWLIWLTLVEFLIFKDRILLCGFDWSIVFLTLFKHFGIGIVCLFLLLRMLALKSKGIIIFLVMLANIGWFWRALSLALFFFFIHISGIGLRSIEGLLLLILKGITFLVKLSVSLLLLVLFLLIIHWLICLLLRKPKDTLVIIWAYAFMRWPQYRLFLSWAVLDLVLNLLLLVGTLLRKVLVWLILPLNILWFLDWLTEVDDLMFSVLPLS